MCRDYELHEFLFSQTLFSKQKMTFFKLQFKEIRVIRKIRFNSCKIVLKSSFQLLIRILLWEMSVIIFLELNFYFKSFSINNL